MTKTQTPAVTAPDPKASAEAPAAKPKITSVPADIRARVLGGRPPAPKEPSAEEKAANEKAEREAAEKKAADDKAAKEKADTEKAAADKAAEEKKVKRVKQAPPLPEKPEPKADASTVEELVRKVIPEIQRKDAPPPPKLAPEDERDLELARFAEKSDPQRYSGFADRVAGFFSARDTHLTKKAEELGGANSPEFREYLRSEEFREWADGQRPAFQRGDKTKFQEAIITARARQEARKELEPELKQLKRKQAELESAPVIQANAAAAMQIILSDPGQEKDPALAAFNSNQQQFAEQHPEDARIIATHAQEYVDLVQEVFRIDRGLVDVDPEARPQQRRIQETMDNIDAALRKNNPTGLVMQDETILVDTQTYRERGLSKDPRYRTVNAVELAGALASQGNALLLKKLQARRDEIAKSIYAPQSPTQAKPPSGQETPSEEDPPAPAAAVRPASGAPSKSGGLTKLQELKRRHL